MDVFQPVKPANIQRRFGDLPGLQLQLKTRCFSSVRSDTINSEAVSDADVFRRSQVGEVAGRRYLAYLFVRTAINDYFAKMYFTGEK